MKKSPVAGIAGAARIDQLSMAELTHAELHGKRLDRTGKSRAINNEPPVTTTGLDLNDLFRAHVAGAFVPRARAKAMQVIIQFPKELVDGDDAGLMLHHARAFTETVFGPDAIFADRVDRDEEGRHVVDLFIAPKYVKKTKRDEKVAVSVSRHQKELAEKYKCPPTPIGTGRALQQALFEYLRDDMGLVGVKRGEPKMIPGPDWKASEQLRVEELDAQKEDLVASMADVARQKAALDAAEVDNARRAADRDSALVDRERRASDREQELTRLAATAADREDALARREAEIAAAGARADAAQAAANGARVALEVALAEARRVGEEAAHDREVAQIVLADAGAERVRLDAERRLRDQQFALLVRGTDDDSGLDLRATEKSFSMCRDAMRSEEHPTYDTKWSDSLIRLGRQLAQLLEKARQLLVREKRVEARETAVARREQDAARDFAAKEQEHAIAFADIQRRERDVAVREDIAAAQVADADIKAAAASAREADASATLVRNNRWALALDAIIEQPDGVDIVESRIQIDRDAPVAFDKRVVAALRDQPPTWAVNALYARLDLADREREMAAHRQFVARSAEELNELLTRAGRELTPKQQELVDKAEASVRRAGSVAAAWKTSQGNMI